MNKNEEICSASWSSISEKIDCLRIGQRMDGPLESYFDSTAGFLNLGNDLK